MMDQNLLMFNCPFMSIQLPSYHHISSYIYHLSVSQSSQSFHSSDQMTMIPSRQETKPPLQLRLLGFTMLLPLGAGSLVTRRYANAM